MQVLCDALCRGAGAVLGETRMILSAEDTRANYSASPAMPLGYLKALHLCVNGCELNAVLLDAFVGWGQRSVAHAETTGM